MTMKTVDVAKSLGIHPSTVLKWVKMANIELERNESGHCEFTEKNIEALRNFQKNRNRQAVVKVVEKEEVVISDERAQDMQKQLDQLFLRLIENEKRTEEKAGEVVTFQILEHRSEIDRLNKVITKLENRVVELESQLKSEDSLKGKKPVPRWRSFLTGIFSY
ncbi:MerR family transcriptional regulator [Priestia megaterium]|uniref:MerR family transcriptional regulator n=1 Tax=Priestia megaterium TaxID=1404 RepID=UPI002E1E238B|nr:MerR family transcriptional regulator [Priestia megaterium]MED3941576.1 MerR family transcriptional regulator [Priestia megaterium]